MIGVKRLKQSFRNVLGLLAIAALALGLFIIPGTASAASNSLGFTPTKTYTIKPGGSVSDTLYVSNLNNNSPLSLSMKVVDFTGSGETGTPALHLGSATPTPYSLKPFLTIPTLVNIPAGKDAYVPINISIPANQGAGSYYSAVEYSANTGGATGAQNVSLAASGVTLVFVTVPGHTSEILNLKGFGAYNPTSNAGQGNFSTWYFGSQPTEMGYLLDDQGNVAEQPAGSILIKNIFGHQTYNITEANPNDSLVLIGQTRLFTACIISGHKTVTGSTGQSVTETVCEKPNLAPGRYSATLDVFYAQNSGEAQQIVGTATFWYLPVWFIIVVILVLFIIILAILLIVKKIRKSGHSKKVKADSTS